jgi:hypothetical protein
MDTMEGNFSSADRDILQAKLQGLTTSIHRRSSFVGDHPEVIQLSSHSCQIIEKRGGYQGLNRESEIGLFQTIPATMASALES